MMIIVLIVVGWVVCSVLAYGNTLAWTVSLDKEYRLEGENWRLNVTTSLFCSFCGPLALLINLLEGDWRHGLVFRNPYKRR